MRANRDIRIIMNTKSKKLFFKRKKFLPEEIFIILSIKIATKIFLIFHTIPKTKLLKFIIFND